MKVTDEGKKFYCEVLGLYYNTPKQDAFTKRLLKFITTAISVYNGDEDLSINVPLSAVINIKKVSENERYKLISESVNDLMSGPLKVESNCNSKQFASFIMISYFTYKPGDSHFEVKVPLTIFSDWTSHQDVIPNFGDMFKDNQVK
ncbi:hypothetical protein [Macellibacteroides fermentans]|uniref:hypothetical protein n=1 Tax=Macellibacteroides fermentans TaxID=879969 RepID=UPI00406CBB1D